MPQEGAEHVFRPVIKKVLVPWGHWNEQALGAPSHTYVYSALSNHGPENSLAHIHL